LKQYMPRRPTVWTITSRRMNDWEEQCVASCLYILMICVCAHERWNQEPLQKSICGTCVSSLQFLFETCFSLWDTSCTVCVPLSSFYKNWNVLNFIKLLISDFL
jgi:hypothetical protein